MSDATRTIEEKVVTLIKVAGVVGAVICFASWIFPDNEFLRIAMTPVTQRQAVVILVVSLAMLFWFLWRLFKGREK